MLVKFNRLLEGEHDFWGFHFPLHWVFLVKIENIIPCNEAVASWNFNDLLVGVFVHRYSYRNFRVRFRLPWLFNRVALPSSFGIKLDSHPDVVGIHVLLPEASKMRGVFVCFAGMVLPKQNYRVSCKVGYPKETRGGQVMYIMFITDLPIIWCHSRDVWPTHKIFVFLNASQQSRTQIERSFRNFAVGCWGNCIKPHL